MVVGTDVHPFHCVGYLFCGKIFCKIWCHGWVEEFEV